MRGRRSFLKGAGAVAAGAFAVKKSPTMGSPMNVGAISSAALADAKVNAGPVSIGGPIDFIPSKLAGIIRAIGIPDWKRDEMRAAARYSARTIDPDIACLRSVSLSGKIQMQYERNLSRMERDMWRYFDREEARRAFHKLHGVEWY